MKSFSKFITQPLGVISGLIVLVLSLLTVVDVISRFTTSKSVPGAIEYSEVLLVMCVFFAFGAAQNNGSHVSTSVLTEKLPLKVRKILTRFVALISVVIIAAAMVAAILEAWRSFTTGEYRFGLAQVPLWPAKAAVAIGMVVYLVEFIRSYFFTPTFFTEEADQRSQTY